MNKKLVTSKELSKKIFDLGVRVESEFYWYNYELCFYDEVSGNYYGDNGGIYEPVHVKKDLIPALLTGELGMMLPQSIFLPKNYDYRWRAIMKNVSFSEETEADCRAKMLIYLIEQGLIKVEDIKLYE